MTTETPRLPGVFFEAPPPPREDTLPRMDVAAFVGFAETGPLHLPVAVESPRRFREIFGSDIRLAWDDERGELRRAHLGPAVEAFFANGGLRCWIVRVADPAEAANHSFPLPGLIAAGDRNLTPPPLARARARAPGSWCENLAASTALSRDPLRLHESGTAVVLAAGGYRVDVAADPSRLQAGDLLEVTFGPGAPVLLLFAERVIAIPGGLRAESGAVDFGGETIGAFWIQAGTEETAPPLPVNEGTAIAAAQASLGSPATRPVVRRLSFEILIRRGSELHRQIGDLAFRARHPRFWASLPNDDELFRLPAGAVTPDEPQGLGREASSPRFPLAGPIGAPATYYLPWGMGRSRAPEAALPITVAPGSTALERDGLAQFGAGLFVDYRLAHIGMGALLGEAEHRFYIAGTPLSGFHSLLPIEEVSIVAVPDAVHRGWSRELPPERLPLGAPQLLEIPAPDSAGRYNLTWTAAGDAEGYTLQRDVDPAFDNAVVAFEGSELTAAVAIDPGCPRDLFFRVRAFRSGEVGPWSNTRGARLPREDFAACADVRPPALVLSSTPDGSPGPALIWISEDPTEALPAAVEIQTSTDPGFSAAEPFAPDGLTAGSAPLPSQRVAARYYRIRGVDASVHGTWSNTVRIAATTRAAFTEPPARNYDASAMLAVHRALLRFAAARGDFLAVLSLPDHYRGPEALEHVGRLTPGGPEEEPAPPPSSPLFPRVPQLTEGEAAVLSCGALYHPWILARASGDSSVPLRRLPPDAAFAGVMAAMALDAGAWRAPANRPLTGVVGLEPDLRATDWARLVMGRVNALVGEPRGFLTRSEDTLGGERALGRIHVRRLMILLRRLALREGQLLVFEPHGPQLRRRIRNQFDRLLGELFRRGAFAGRDASDAFRVVADETVNPRESVDRGRLIVELRVAPAAALAFLTVRLITAGPGRVAVEEA